jgi:hypothetical protein
VAKRRRTRAKTPGSVAPNPISAGLAAWERMTPAQRAAYLARIGAKPVMAVAQREPVRLDGSVSDAQQPSNDADAEMRQIQQLWNKATPEGRHKTWQEIVNMPAAEGGFDGDARLALEYIWLYGSDEKDRQKFCLDNARELNAMTDAHIKERLAGIDNGMDLEMARTFNNIDQLRRQMPNNKDVEDLYDIFLAIFAARAQAQNKARFDAEMKRRRG